MKNFKSLTAQGFLADPQNEVDEAGLIQALSRRTEQLLSEDSNIVVETSVVSRNRGVFPGKGTGTFVNQMTTYWVLGDSVKEAGETVTVRPTEDVGSGP